MTRLDSSKFWQRQLPDGQGLFGFQTSPRDYTTLAKTKPALELSPAGTLEQAAITGKAIRALLDRSSSTYEAQLKLQELHQTVSAAGKPGDKIIAEFRWNLIMREACSAALQSTLSGTDEREALEGWRHLKAVTVENDLRHFPPPRKGHLEPSLIAAIGDCLALRPVVLAQPDKVWQAIVAYCIDKTFSAQCATRRGCRDQEPNPDPFWRLLLRDYPCLEGENFQNAAGRLYKEYVDCVSTVLKKGLDAPYPLQPGMLPGSLRQTGIEGMRTLLHLSQCFALGREDNKSLQFLVTDGARLCSYVMAHMRKKNPKP